MKSYNIWPFVSCSFQLAWCSQTSFMLQHVSVFHSFSWPNNILYYGHISFYLSIHLLMDIWIVSQISNFWQLWIMPLQRVTYKYLSPILLGRYLGMEWLDHVIILGFFTEKYQIIFYNGCTILYSQQQCMRIIQLLYNRIQFSSVTQSCLTLCDSMDCSMPGLPVHHQLLEFTQTHVHWVGDVIQPSQPLLSPSPPAFSLSQHQGLFKWVSSSHQVCGI